MEESYIFVILLIELLAFAGLYISNKYNIPSSDLARKYEHLYVTGFVLFVKSVWTFCDITLLVDDNFSASYNAHPDSDQETSLIVGRGIYRIGALIVTASIYGICYKRSANQNSWSCSFALAIASVWVFLAAFLYGPAPVKFNMEEGLTKTRWAGDAVLWSAFLGFALGTVVVQQFLRPEQTAPPCLGMTYRADCRTESARLRRIGLLFLGMIAPASLLLYLKITHGTGGVLLRHFQHNPMSFLLATVCVAIWTATYLAILSAPELSQTWRVNFAWSILLLATHLLVVQAPLDWLDAAAFLNYTYVVLIEVAVAVIVQVSRGNISRPSDSSFK